VHTFYPYLPPQEHFGSHPEWYALVGGQRRDKEAQLCLTNDELRGFFTGLVRASIETSSSAAARAGRPPPAVFEISQNDYGGFCECERCEALARSEGSQAGPLLDFVNCIAAALEKEHPEVSFSTLAYFDTQKPPRTIRPRHNVIVRLCDTGSDFTKPITSPENRAFREHLLSWEGVGGTLRVWDYAVSYGPGTGFPMPSVRTYAPDFRFYREHKVEGVFTELEWPILADTRDLKVWTMMKLLEDPGQDPEALIRTFSDGFYGAAGAGLRDYLALLEAAALRRPSPIGWGAAPRPRGTWT